MNIKNDNPFKELEEERKRLAIQKGLKQRKEREKERNIILNELIYMLYNNFKPYFDTGDLVFTGSLVHIANGFLDKDRRIGDIDLSVIRGTEGDLILDKLKAFFEQENFFIEGKYVERDWSKGRRAWFMNKYVCIDIFRAYHIKELSEDVEIRKGVITKYFGHQWIYDLTYDDYMIFKAKPQTEYMQQKVIKFESLLKNIKEYGKI